MSTAATPVKTSNSRNEKKVAPVKASTVRKPNRKTTATQKAPKLATKAQSKSAPVTKQTVSVATGAVAPKVSSSSKKTPPKVKLIRDSFTFPEADHDLIKQCKKAAIAGGRETKKSEVVRAAIRAFSELPVSQQLAAYGKLQAIAVGRPKAK
jgi:hypothetical protein